MQFRNMHLHVIEVIWAKRTVADDAEVMNIVLPNLHTMLFTKYIQFIYIPVIYAAMEEATNQTYHAKSERHANS